MVMTRNCSIINYIYIYMNILITGVAGLLGSNFARYVLENKGINIIGIDDLSGGYIDNVPDGVDFYNIHLLEHN